MPAGHQAARRASSRPQLTLPSGASSASSLHSGEFPQLPLSPTTLEQAAFLPGIARLSPSPNFEGSWLDIETDDEDDTFTRRSTLVRTPRKNSGSSMKDPSHSRNPLAGIRELTHRSSMHLRKLTVKMTR